MSSVESVAGSLSGAGVDTRLGINRPVVVAALLLLAAGAAMAAATAAATNEYLTLPFMSLIPPG